MTNDYVDIVFDGPPEHVAGRFVEVEDSSGASIKFGDWVHREDGFWALRIPAPAGPIGSGVDAGAKIVEMFEPNPYLIDSHPIDDVVQRSMAAQKAAYIKRDLHEQNQVLLATVEHVYNANPEHPFGEDCLTCGHSAMWPTHIAASPDSFVKMRMDELRDD